VRTSYGHKSRSSNEPFDFEMLMEDAVVKVYNDYNLMAYLTCPEDKNGQRISEHDN